MCTYLHADVCNGGQKHTSEWSCSRWGEVWNVKRMSKSWELPSANVSEVRWGEVVLHILLLATEIWRLGTVWWEKTIWWKWQTLAWHASWGMTLTQHMLVPNFLSSGQLLRVWPTINSLRRYVGTVIVWFVIYRASCISGWVGAMVQFLGGVDYWKSVLKTRCLFSTKHICIWTGEQVEFAWGQWQRPASRIYLSVPWSFGGGEFLQGISTVFPLVVASI
jgi:hypothetical protein